MPLRQRPKSDYLRQASFESLFVLTEHWDSELNFFKDELRFLKDLLDKYFIWLTREDHLEKVQELVDELHHAENDQNKISLEIKHQLSQITELMENSFSHDETAFRNKHEKLEDEITQFYKDARKLKKHVFITVKDLLAEEKLQHLLKA